MACGSVCRFHDQDVVVDYALPPKKQRVDQESSDEKDSKSASKDSPKSITPVKILKPATCKVLPTQTSILSEKILRSHVKSAKSCDLSSKSTCSCRKICRQSFWVCC